MASYPTTPFERAVDDAIARENARYLATPEAAAHERLRNAQLADRAAERAHREACSSGDAVRARDTAGAYADARTELVAAQRALKAVQ